MKSFFIVQAESKRYHIYNSVGNFVALADSRIDVIKYFDEVLSRSSCTSFGLSYTAAAGTFIVYMFQSTRPRGARQLIRQVANNQRQS